MQKIWLLLIIVTVVLAFGCNGDNDDSEEAEDTEIDDSDSDTEVEVDVDWPVPPTGQTACYDNSEEIDCPDMPCEKSDSFCGQDSQYPDHTQKFTESTVGSDVIITDLLTGLIWQKDYSEEKTWEEALEYCPGLSYADESDWRLADVHELSSLINFGKYGPASNFPDMPSVYFWSSSVDVSDPEDGTLWLVDFGFGLVRRQVNIEDTRPVRCVRGGTPVDTKDRYKVSDSEGQDIVLDKATGLTWAKDHVNGKTWEEALQYCQDLDYGGFDDWRLPDVQTLRGLLDFSLAYPSTSFPGLRSEYLWASSSSVYYTDNGWCVHFPRGSVMFGHKSFNELPETEEDDMAAKCVRGGP
ncbi:MAG: DUF1566 domain-containing protein [Proteobacteria bacterium]|nr:DUF1566 domain-containing protein [Pseudomonadota bacterium]